MKRLARLLSALLIALLAYAAAGEGACAAEGGPVSELAMAGAPDHGAQHQSSDKDRGCAHGCIHGHHHLDTAFMAGVKLTAPGPRSDLAVQAALVPPPHRPGSLERPPRI